MKTNKIIQLLFVAVALISCSKELPTNDNTEVNSTSINLTPSLNNLYSDSAATKAGGSGDIPSGYQLVATMQVYECDSEGVVADSPIYSTTEYVVGDDVVNEQLEDLDIFNDINLPVDQSFKVFGQFYYAPMSDEDQDIYTFDSSSKLYTRNYDRKVLGDDAEDFYAGTTTFTVDANGEVTDGSLVIEASRVVSKLSLDIATLNRAVTIYIEIVTGVFSEDITNVTYDLVNNETYQEIDMNLVYTDFKIPSYNYYTNDVEYVTETDEQHIVEGIASFGTVSDYVFIPNDGIDFRVNPQVIYEYDNQDDEISNYLLRETIVEDSGDGTGANVTSYAYRTIFVDLSNVNRVFKYVSDNTDGVTTGLNLYEYEAE